MATLQKIRNKGVFLVVIIGLALFAFIVGDFLNSGSSFFHKSRQTVAKILGESINIKEYSALVEEMSEVYKIETGTSQLNEEMTSQIRQSVWESLLNEKLLDAETEKLGLTVSPEELADRCYGKNIHSLILQRRMFMGENGQFSQAALMQFLTGLNQSPTNNEMKEQLEKAKTYWNFLQRNVRIAVLQEKYNMLLGKTLNSNSLEAKTNYSNRHNTLDVQYVAKAYFLVPNTGIKVTDSELKERYEKEKEQYKMDANCSFDYISFSIKPQPQDYAEADTWMKKLENEFKTTNDVAGLVNSNSDVMYDGRLYSKNTVPANLKDFAFSNGTGAIYGPVFQNDTYTMARVMESGIMKSDSAKLRHIFLVKDIASKSDSIVKALKSGADFATLAKKYSAVQQTAAHGGEIGWITETMNGMDKEISSAAFSKPIHEIFTLKNDQGVQIMEVMERTAPKQKVKLAILERKVVASSKTNSKIYNEATQFSVDLTASNFESKAKEKGYKIQNATDVLQSSDKVSDIPQSRQIVRWAFNNSKGTVSKVFECSNQYIIALVKDKYEKGYRTFDQLKEKLTADIIKDKKAEILIKSMSEELSKTHSLEAISASIKDSIKMASGLSFNAFQFGTSGYEPEVIGKSFTLPLNTVSAPIKGNRGVFVIEVVNKKENPQPFNVITEKIQMSSQKAYAFPYMVMRDIRDNADIKDNRLNFY